MARKFEQRPVPGGGRQFELSDEPLEPHEAEALRTAITEETPDDKERRLKLEHKLREEAVERAHERQRRLAREEEEREMRTEWRKADAAAKVAGKRRPPWGFMAFVAGALAAFGMANQREGDRSPSRPTVERSNADGDRAERQESRGVSVEEGSEHEAQMEEGADEDREREDSGRAERVPVSYVTVLLPTDRQLAQALERIPDRGEDIIVQYYIAGPQGAEGGIEGEELQRAGHSERTTAGRPAPDMETYSGERGREMEVLGDVITVKFDAQELQRMRHAGNPQHRDQRFVRIPVPETSWGGNDNRLVVRVALLDGEGNVRYQTDFKTLEASDEEHTVSMGRLERVRERNSDRR
ncbi:hypothetical protein L0Y34_01515 [Candidatus Parcubacteria bacterium]|nr:hypothetical protein [Candidatus Parcubacteria bacterium]